MWCGGARTSDSQSNPILAVASAQRRQTTANNTFTTSWNNHHSAVYFKYISPLNPLYHLFMTLTMTRLPRHWPSRACHRRSHEIYTCSITRQLLPSARAAAVGGLGPVNKDIPRKWRRRYYHNSRDRGLYPQTRRKLTTSRLSCKRVFYPH